MERSSSRQRRAHVGHFRKIEIAIGDRIAQGLIEFFSRA
jgi:hypothetical protein